MATVGDLLEGFDPSKWKKPGYLKQIMETNLGRVGASEEEAKKISANKNLQIQRLVKKPMWNRKTWANFLDHDIGKNFLSQPIREVLMNR